MKSIFHCCRLNWLLGHTVALVLLMGCNQPVKTYSIFFQSKDFNDNIKGTIYAEFNITCSTVFGSASNDYTQNNVISYYTGFTIQILQNHSCTLTLESFSDGTNIYNAVTTLTVTISATGTVTSPNTGDQAAYYTSSSGVNLYIDLQSSTSTSLTLGYSYDPVEEPVTFVPGGSSCTSGTCSNATANTIGYKFSNSSSISAGSYIWFNAQFTVSGLSSSVTTNIFLTSSSVSFTSNGTNYNVTIPDSVITFNSTATCGSINYVTTSGTWHVTLPNNGTISTSQIFLSGAALPVGTTLTGSINPVTWTGKFYSDQSSISITWKWSAAVYSSSANFSNYNNIQVNPTAVSNCYSYSSSYLAGTPVAEISFVKAGADGGGSPNYTGTFSSTNTVSANNCVPTCSNPSYQRCPVVCTIPSITPDSLLKNNLLLIPSRQSPSGW